MLSCSVTANTKLWEPLPADRLHRYVDAASPSPAAAYDAHYDYVAWNRAYEVVRHDPGAVPPQHRNLLWLLVTDPAIRARMPGWEGAVRAVLGQFRAAAGQGAGDPRFAELRAPTFYLVGNGAMITELKRELIARGVNRKLQIRTEAFFD